MFPVSLDGTLPQWEFAVPKMKLSTSKLLKSLVILFSFETFSAKFFVVPFFLSIFAIDQASRSGRAGHNIDGIRRLRHPFVRTARGKGRFRTLLSVIFKLRKLESKCRCNATKRLRGCIISRRIIALNIYLRCDAESNL